MVRFSLLVLHYNHLENTQKCLHSLLQCEHQDSEIIVLDNGSAVDDTQVLQKEFGAQITVFRSAKNKGSAGGYSMLMKAAKGDILVVINNDIEVSPGWLTALDTAFQNPQVGVCFPKLRSFYHRDTFEYAGACGGFVDLLGYPFARGRVLSTLEKDSGQYDIPIHCEWSGPLIAFRRKAYEESGGWDTRFFAYMDEIDLCWRIRSHGWTLLSVPSSVVYHQGGVTWRKESYRKNYYLHCNNLRLFLKNVPYPWLLLLLPLRIGCELLTVLWYVLKGRMTTSIAVCHALIVFLCTAPCFVSTHQPRSMMLFRRSIVWDAFLHGRKTWSALMK